MLTFQSGFWAQVFYLKNQDSDSSSTWSFPADGLVQYSALLWIHQDWRHIKIQGIKKQSEHKKERNSGSKGDQPSPLQKMQSLWWAAPINY